MKRYIRQGAGLVLLPVALVLITIIWMGDRAEELYDRIREGPDEMLGGL